MCLKLLFNKKSLKKMTDNFIITDITDREYTQLDVNSELVSIKGEGKVITKNPSQKSSLWDITNDLKDIDNTNLSNNVLEIESLNPGEEHIQEYEIHQLKAPCLKIVEIFDAGRDTEDTVNNVLLYKNANKCKLTLTFTNTLDKQIVEIKAKREMPSMYTEIQFGPLNNGKADLSVEDGKRFLIWEIESLGAKETAELQLTCTVYMEEKTKQSLGGLNVTYLINNHILTIINPEVRGLSDSMSGVTRDEGSNPGTWDCNIEFINNSEFRVKLEDVKIDHEITTGKEIVVSQSPNQEISAEGSWVHDFNVESTNVPKLDFTIVFTPLFEVNMKVIGEINKESTIYDVFAAEIAKSIIPPEVVAYANTDMKIDNIIPNIGTAPIDTLSIEDDIPEDFIPPEVAQITLTVKNPEVTSEIQSRREFVESINIEPDDISPDKPHKIIIFLKDLKNQLPAGAELKMSYPILAKNPKPDVTYNTPVKIKANTPRKGKIFEISPPEEPMIKIKYIQRKFKTLKSVRPGTNKGEFKITVRIQNKGEVELENILIQDIIPSGFSLSEFIPPKDIAHKILPKGDETEFRIKIGELKGNNSINIDYVCSGSGKYPRAELEVTVLGRDDISSWDEPVPEVAPEGTPEVAPELIPEVAPEPTPEPVPEIASEDAIETAPKIDVSPNLLPKLFDLFLDVTKKIDSNITVSELIDILNSKKEEFSEGLIRREFNAFIQKFENIEVKDKKIVGATQDKIKADIETFHKRFV